MTTQLKCPKCESTSLTIHPYSSKYTITDYHLDEGYMILRCNECRYEFSSEPSN